MITMASHRSMQALRLTLGLLLLALLASGCGGKKPVRARVSYPPIPQRPAPDVVQDRENQGDDADDVGDSASAERLKNAKPIYVERGLASWYGPPYHNRKAASGEIFNTHALTAAHKTLPLHSVVRVTNEKTKESVIVRINDRGPFIGDRIIDLSLAAAKKVSVWRAGVAKVKLEVLSAPAPLDRGGRWCVQIGAFSDEDEASKLKNQLMRRYSSAKVIQFSGPTGEWVRLRPFKDDRERAFQVARETRVSEGGVFLVRLD
jgi:rare lipoprotein A